MRRRAVREVVEVEVEEEGFGGAPLGIEMPLGWSVAILLEVDSMHQNAGLMLSRSMLSAMEVERADLPRHLSPTTPLVGTLR